MGATILLICQECGLLCYYLEKIFLLESRFYCYGNLKVVNDEKVMPCTILSHLSLSYRLGATNFIEPFFLCYEQDSSKSDCGYFDALDRLQQM
jgi:hypothetical protein